MVVGSLLVMAAQTVTAVPCSSISGSSSPTLAVLCEQPLYTESKLTSALNTECTNNPCTVITAVEVTQPRVANPPLIAEHLVLQTVL